MAATFTHLDSAIVLSCDMASEGLYPAVDPLASSSTLLDPSVVGKRHYDIAEETRRLIEQYQELREIISLLGIEELSASDRKAVARSIGYPRVVTQITNPELQPIIDQLGLGETITPHESVARSLVEALEQHDRMSTVGVLKNELRLALVTVSEGFAEMPFAKIALPETVQGIARIRQDAETVLTPDASVRPQDQLLLLSAAKDHDGLLSSFAEPEGE